MTILFSSPRRLIVGVGFAALAVAASQTSALAHITLATAEARPNAYYKAVFQVPHGCDGAATQAIRNANLTLGYEENLGIDAASR